MNKLLMAGVAAGALSLAYASSALANPFSNSSNFHTGNLSGQNANEATDSNIGQNNTWRLDATITYNTVTADQSLRQEVTNNRIDNSTSGAATHLTTGNINNFHANNNAGVTGVGLNTGLQSNVSAASNIAAIAVLGK